MYFFQIGCADNVNYVDLAHSDWSGHFDFPGIDSDTEWQGVLVDLHPVSVIDMVQKFSPDLTVVNAAVTGKNEFVQMQGNHGINEIDEKAMLSTAERYNDWHVKHEPELMREHAFQNFFFCYTVTLEQLFSTFAPDSEIGLLALDVQGSEVEILTAYDWEKKPYYIDVEPHSDEAKDIIWRILEDQGYRVMCERHDDFPRVNYLWELR